MKIILIVIFLLITISVSAQQSSSPQTTALNLLKTRESKVKWNSQSLLKADFDYDGIIDYAAGGKKGRQYVVGIVKGPLKNNSKHWALAFSGNSDDQDSLCSVATAKIELEPLDEEVIPNANKLSKKSRGIELSGGECDPFHIFFDPNEKRFNWWRN